jgi:histone H3/H4
MEEYSDMSNEKSEVLVVSSKVKNYIKSTSGLNTSAAIMDILTDKVKELCDQAIENAKNDKRKTVKEKDFS